LLLLDNRWQTVAADNGPMLLYRISVVDTGQCDDCLANDSGDHQAMRGDAAESNSDFNRDGGLLQHRRRRNADRRSAECHHRFQSRCQKRCKCSWPPRPRSAQEQRIIKW